MEPIRVPRPPAEAFNKKRRVSDLIRAQVNHFKHVEAARGTAAHHSATWNHDGRGCCEVYCGDDGDAAREVHSERGSWPESRIEKESHSIPPGGGNSACCECRE